MAVDRDLVCDAAGAVFWWVGFRLPAARVVPLTYRFVALMMLVFGVLTADDIAPQEVEQVLRLDQYL